MPDTLILHVGLPKTGSSALQVFLARNREKLLRQSVDYFELGEFSAGRAGRITAGNGLYVARCLHAANHPGRWHGRKPIDDLVAAIAASQARTGLVSSEVLAKVDPVLFAAFVRELQARGLTVKISYLVRSQLQFLCSNYVQDVKTAACMDDASSVIMSSYRNFPFLNYGSYHRTMTDLVSAENVIVGIYEEMSLDDGLCRNFLLSLGLETEGLEDNLKNINTGMAPQELDILRKLNRYMPRSRFADHIVENAADRGVAGPGRLYDFLSAEDSETITRYFEPENRLLAENAFGGRPLFGGRSNTQLPTRLNDKELNLEDVIDFFGNIMVRLDRKIGWLERHVAELKQAQSGP